MPTLPPVPRVIRVDWHFAQSADANVQARAFFEYTGALSQADAVTWCGSCATAWVNRMLPQQTSDIALTSTVLTDLSSGGAAQAISATTGTGSLAGGNTASAVCAVIKRRIGRRFRGGHSRLYLASPGQAQLATANTWAPAYITALATAYSNLVSDIVNAVPVAAAPAFEVTVSYFNGFTVVTATGRRAKNVPNVRPVPQVDLVLSHSVNPKVGSQRRRNLQSA